MSKQQPSSVKATTVNDPWNQPAPKAVDAYIPVPQQAPLEHVQSTKYIVPVVPIAEPGQSYHPDFESHQDTLAAAVAEELVRCEKEREEAKPISGGLGPETKPFINDNDEESEGEDEESDTLTISVNDPVENKKMTRAQRNKQTRVRRLELELDHNRMKKQLKKQINMTHQILKEVKEHEKECEARREIQKFQQEQKWTSEAPIRVGTKHVALEKETAVALSDELSGSLRLVLPKGDLLVDRFNNFKQRNLFDANEERVSRRRTHRFRIR